MKLVSKRILGWDLVILGLVLSISTQGKAEAERYTREVVASKFQYSPSVIRFPVRQRSVIIIHSKDVLHGFFVPDLSIRVDLKPGVKQNVMFPALEPGKYPFV